MEKILISNFADSRVITYMIDIIIICGMYGIMLLLINSTRLIEKYIKVKEYDINTNIKILENDFLLLDTLIEGCLKEYILVSGLHSVDFIKESDEIKMNTGVSELLKNRLSNLVLTKLHMIYKADKLSDVIASKIYLHITAYVIEHNKPTDTPNI